MEDAQARRARLRALRAEAASGGAEEAVPASAAPAEAEQPSEPVLKFRNYAVKDEKRIEHEKVAPAQPPEFEEVRVDPDAILGTDPEEVIINVAPKRANWDLRRDIAAKLAKLERRTQSAMIKLAAQEEQRRAAEAQE